MPFALDVIRPRLRPSLVALLVVTIVAGLVGGQSFSATNTRSNGYWIALALGDVRAFGDAPPLGGTSRVVVTDMATTPTGRGYWLATALGPIVSIGDARAFVSGVRHGGPIVAIGARPQGDGVWLLSTSGDVLPFGAARAFAPLDRRVPLIDLAVTPSGEGFWALDIAGGVQVRGDATAHGNAPAARLAIAIAPTPSGDGYWVLSASGLVVARGAAPSLGSAARSAAYVDMAVTHSGRGYWLVDAVGRVTRLGDAVHYGDLGAPSFLRAPAVAIAATPFVNLPPIAVEDAASLDEDTTIDVAVLANDSDAEGDPLSVRITVPPLRGVATVLPDKKIRYTPAPNVNGSDQLTYEVDDGLGGRASAVVRFTIRPINDPPAVASAIADQTVNEDAADIVLDLASVFADVDIATNGDSLTLSVAGNTNAALVTTTLLGNGLTLHFAANGNGSADITIRATDGAGAFVEDTFRVTVTPVNDAPVVASPIADQNASEDAADLTLSLAGVFTDVDSGDSLTLSVAGNTNAALVTASLVGSSLTLHFALNGNGLADITIRATDGAGAFAEDTFRVTVDAANDPPVVATPIADQTASEDAADRTLDLAGVFSDVDIATNADTLTLSVTGNTNSALVTATLIGSSLTLHFALNGNGISDITIRATDGAGAFAQDTFRVTVTPVNDPPVVANPIADQTVSEDAPDLVLGLASVFGDVDIATNADILTLSVTGNTNTALVTATLGSNSVTLHFATNGSGTADITIRATDGAGAFVEDTLRVTVSPVNDVPTATNDSYTTAEDAILSVPAPGVLANDSDVEGDAISAALVSGPTQGTLILQPSGAFTYTPNANRHGPDSFTYSAVDATGASSPATVTITVTPVNDAPVATNDTYTVTNTATLNVTAPGVLGNDADVDGDALSATLVAGPAVGTLTLNTNGSFSYSPQSGHVGTVTFTYRASDGTLTDDATVSISVTSGGGGGTGGSFNFGTPIPELFDFESYNGFPATPGHVGRETLGGVEVEILGPWWLE